MVCTLVDRDGIKNYCERHKMQHRGHYAAYAIDPGEKGERFRKLWDKQAGLAKPIRQPLSLVKLCQHNTGVNGTAKAGCTTCTTYGCNVHGTVRLKDCVYCEDYQEKPAIKAGSSWKAIRFDHTNLYPEIPGMRFNPSIIESSDGYIFAFRNGWRGSRIFLCRLTKDFQPAGEVAKLQLPTSGVIGHEDPRLFRLNGKLHIVYVAYTGKRTHVKFSRINEDRLTVEDNFFPQIDKRASWEKNHSYFDYQGIAHAVYDSTPNHRILKIEGSRTEWAYSSPFKHAWSGGYIRGGCSPVLVDGKWYHWFHGVTTQKNGRRLYNMGLIVFRAEPPFDILAYTPSPIDVADPSVTPKDQWADVIFPCGAVLAGDRWAIAMGVADRWSEIRFYDRQAVESSLHHLE